MDKNRDSKGRFVKGSTLGFQKGNKVGVGRIPWNKNLTTKTDERVRKLGKKSSEVRKKLFAKGKITPGMTGKTPWNKNLTKEIDARVKQLSDSKKGYKHTEEAKKKMGLSSIGRIPWSKGLNKELDKRLKIISEKNKISVSKLWENKEYRENILSEENRKKRLNGLFKRPTSFEQKICDLCIKYNLPFLYKGDGGFLINFKNPDFVNEKDKVVIEVFYSWFKIRDYGSVENYKEYCRRKYNPAGWKVIFIDELDLSHKNWEEVCMNKINCVKVLQ